MHLAAALAPLRAPKPQEPVSVCLGTGHGTHYPWGGGGENPTTHIAEGAQDKSCGWQGRRAR